MDARIEHLVGQGLAKRQGQRIIFVRDLLDTLRRRELEATAARISASSGLPYQPANEGETVARASSGRAALGQADRSAALLTC